MEEHKSRTFSEDQQQVGQAGASKDEATKEGQEKLVKGRSSSSSARRVTRRERARSRRSRKSESQEKGQEGLREPQLAV